MPSRAQDNQQSLFPIDLRKLSEEIGLDWWAAKKLYDDGYLSFDPEIGTTTIATQQSEFTFLGSLVSAGCDPHMLKKLIATLEKPYCYDLTSIYYNWSEQCWMDHDLPLEAIEKGIAELEAAEDVDSLDEIKNKILGAINRLTNEDDVSSELYDFQPEEDAIIAATRRMLLKIAASGLINTPLKAIVVGKLFKVFQDLPKVTANESLSISLAGPRRTYGNHEIYHFWDIQLEEEGYLKISSGGHFYRPETGGDTFTSMTWEVFPGYKPDFEDYLDSLYMVDDADLFENEIADMKLSSGGYKLSVADYSLEEFAEENDDQDEYSYEEEGRGETQSWSVTPLNDSDKRLAVQINEEDVERFEPQYSYGARCCDICKADLKKGGTYVDGKIRDDAGWANMCAPCFEKLGESIGWGVGQLYAQQPDGKWRLVAGFDKGKKSD